MQALFPGINLMTFFRFIYTGEVFVPQHELQGFLRTAELLEIKGQYRYQERRFSAKALSVETHLAANSRVCIGQWSSLVEEDEGWIGPSKKLLCLC